MRHCYFRFVKFLLSVINFVQFEYATSINKGRRHVKSSGNLAKGIFPVFAFRLSLFSVKNIVDWCSFHSSCHNHEIKDPTLTLLFPLYVISRVMTPYPLTIAKPSLKWHNCPTISSKVFLNVSQFVPLLASKTHVVASFQYTVKIIFVIKKYIRFLFSLWACIQLVNLRL